MAFSIFNKKVVAQPKPAATPNRGAARPAHRVADPTRATTTTTEKIDRIEAEMRALEFAPSTAKAAGGKPLIEHGFQGVRPAAPTSAKAVASARQSRQSLTEPSPAGKAKSKPAAASGISSVMMMEILERPFESVPVLEESAILYANRQDDAAIVALEEAMRDRTMPAAAARQAWLMLFDIYENQGKRAEFESIAVDFAVRFETSPPAFNDRSGVREGAAKAGPGQPIQFGTSLDEGSTRQFDQIRAASARSRHLRIDVSKIAAVETVGCDLLRKCMTAVRKSTHRLEVLGIEHLTGVMAGSVDTGRRADPESFWLLLLELYQWQDKQDVFEETALNYCITYEVSPPSWEAPPKPAAPQKGAPTEAPATDACYLKGEIEGNAPAEIKSVADHAAANETLVIDMFEVKRMDFIAAGALLNLIAAQAAGGKTVEIRGPSPLLVTLFVTMGFAEHARMTRRKSQPA